jgi:hypothetical protein
MRAPKLAHLRSQSLDRSGQCWPIKFRLSQRDDVSLPRRVEHDFDPLHRAILLKADNRVNCTRKSAAGASKRKLRATSQPVRNRRVVSMKDYFH